MKISLAMIGRDCAESIAITLDSVLGDIDELVYTDTGSVDNTLSVVREKAKQYGVEYKELYYKDPKGHPKWISNFSNARNVGWSECTGDVILWLDSDDELRWTDSDGETYTGGERLREVVERYMRDDIPRERRIDCMLLPYNYGHDELGYVNVRQSRARLCRRGLFKWAEVRPGVGEPLHETLVPLAPCNMNDEGDKMRTYVVHRTAPGKESSAERNLWVYEQWMADGEEMASRHWRGHMDALRCLGRHAEAVESAKKALAAGDGSADEEYLIHVRLGDSYQLLGQSHAALDEYARAERLFPSYRMAYLAAAETFIELGLWDQAIVWCDKADAAGDDEESLLYNPVAAFNVNAKCRAIAYEQTNRYEEALEQWKRLAEVYKGDEYLDGKIATLENAVKIKAIHASLLETCEMLPDDESRYRLLRAAPDELRFMPGVGRAKRPDRPDGKEVVVIYCGQTVNSWGPNSIETGTGGSEESVIYMSRHLTNLGYYVEVYCSLLPEDIGLDQHGVCWMPNTEWMETDEADVFIAWRHTGAISAASNCGQRWIWLQDIPQHEWYTEDLCDDVDGILCISQFQASHLGEHGIKKAVITANGVEVDILPDDLPSYRNVFIYASSPDRGLLELLKEWPKIRKAIPNAELRVFYGFRDVYLRNAERSGLKMYKLKDEIEGLLDQPGVVNYGMVGQPELHRHFADAGFWLYPTSFEEAFCITAAKAQCLGAIPITSGEEESCLDEVCYTDMGPPSEPGHIRDDPERLNFWTQTVIECADPRNAESIEEIREQMVETARERFDWTHVANQWKELFSQDSASSESPQTFESKQASSLAN